MVPPIGELVLAEAPPHQLPLRGDGDPVFRQDPGFRCRCDFRHHCRPRRILGSTHISSRSEMNVPMTVMTPSSRTMVPGQEHVLRDQRLEQQGTDRRQAQDERHDDASRDDVGKQIADGAHERIEGHPDRIPHDDPVFGQSPGPGGHHVGLAQFIEQVRPHDADQLGGSGNAEDDGRDRQVLGEVPHLAMLQGASAKSGEKRPPTLAPN